MTDDNEPVPVVFRVSKSDPSDVYALFPTIEETRDGMVRCYQHVGQHGNADYLGCIASSRPAKPSEYASLKAELEAAPYHYRLRVMKRRNGRQVRN